MPGSPYEHESFAYCLGAMLAKPKHTLQDVSHARYRPVHAYPTWHSLYTPMEEGNETLGKKLAIRQLVYEDVRASRRLLLRWYFPPDRITLSLIRLSTS